jgi:hypothetical protein
MKKIYRKGREDRKGKKMHMISDSFLQFFLIFAPFAFLAV